MQEKNLAQERYLKEIGCDLKQAQLEVFFMIVDYTPEDRKEKSIPRNIFVPNLKNFSGIAINERDPDDLKKITDLLAGLCQKGYILQEKLLDEVVLTEKATDMIRKLTTNPQFWRSFSPKRWRQAFFEKNKNAIIENISIAETKLIRKLIQKDKILISSVLKDYSIYSEELDTMEKGKRISVNPGKNSIRKGIRFIEGLAESVHRIEMTHDMENLEKYKNEVEALFAAQEPDVSKLWREKYAAAYIQAKGFNTCPIGLPPGCKKIFKDDMDSITPIKQLSIREMKLKINIKKGFGYINHRRDRHILRGMVIEFIQERDEDGCETIRFSGTKPEMIELFEIIKTEAQKMKNKSGPNPEKKLGEVNITSYKEKIIINIETLISVKREKISAIFIEDLDAIIENIKNCPEDIEPEVGLNNPITAFFSEIDKIIANIKNCSENGKPEQTISSKTT
jgi:hypothetical protein